MLRTAAACCLVMVSTARLSGQQPAPPQMPEDVQKAHAAVTAHLAAINSQNHTVVWINAEALAKTLPKHTFFAVRYRIYPVAMPMPEGMKASNIFAVKDGKAEHVKDAKALEAMFKANVATLNNAAANAQAVQSWLWLSQEFVQDGFYKFEILAKEIASAVDDSKHWVSSGRAVVMQGGNGEIKVRISADAEGILLAVTETTQVKPGPRPICQATKLLDADPIVRQMAEQDLLYMGLSAREYLMEQRALADPELRQAIDRIWERIVKDGR